MKTIKIFLASSEELKNDRVSFGNFIRELDKRYQQRGIRIDLYTWEGADGAYNGRRKQDEYNDNVRDSGMLVALFYRKAGGFTQEEFHEAIKNFNITGRPKVYVYFRQLEDESEVSEELKKFKEELEGQNARGHFAYRYNNDDSLHLDFVMQLLLQDKIQKDELNIEEGQVMLNGIVIAQMDNLQFATDNKGYQDLIKDLENIETEMNEARQALVQNPNIEFIKKHFEQKTDEYKQKKKELEKHQKNLLNTAIKFSRLQKDNITEDIKLAIEAFNSGDAPRADYILDQAEHKYSTEQVKELLLSAKEFANKKIEQLLLHASSKITNTNFPIDDRIEQTRLLYEEALSLTEEAVLNKRRRFQVLMEYAHFLYDYKTAKVTLEYLKPAIEILEDLKDADDIELIRSYVFLGNVLCDNSSSYEGKEYIRKALSLAQTPKEPDPLLIASLYSILADKEGSFEFELNQKAFSLHKKNAKYDNTEEPIAYIQMGNYYAKKLNHSLSLRFYKKALSLLKDPNNSKELNLISNLYYRIARELRWTDDYEKIIYYYNEALETCSNKYRRAYIYCELSNLLRYINDFESAYDYMCKALNIEKDIGKTNPELFQIHKSIVGRGVFYGFRRGKQYYDWLYFISQKGNPVGQYYLGLLYQKGGVYTNQNISLAIYYFSKSAKKGYAIAQNALGEIYNDGEIVDRDVSKAKKYFSAVAEQGLVDAQKNLADLYYEENDYNNSFIWWSNAANQGDEIAQFNLGALYDNGEGVNQDYSQAIKWFKKSAEHRFAEALNRLGEMCEEGLGMAQDYDKAFKYYSDATNLAVVKKSIDSMVHLGLLYEKGLGTEMDIDEAYMYFEWAAREGHPFAIGKIGYSYLNGIFYKKDTKRGLKLILKAAEKGDIRATRFLVVLFASGHIVKQNYDKAKEYFNKLPNEKHGDTYNEIAWTLHEKGRYDEALPWAEKAVTAYPNDPDIIDTLATVYQGLKRYEEALEKYELCLKLLKEQEGQKKRLMETEEKIAALKEMMKNGGISEQ